MTTPLRSTLVRRSAIAVGLAFAMGFASAPAVQAQEKGPTVFAAASMKTALDEIDGVWTKKTGKSVTVSYAASSALAKQIEQGAPADVFISADLDWMDYLDKKGLIRTETRSNGLGNALVLVQAKTTAKPVKIEAGFPIATLVGDGKLATGDVKSVPVGKYAKAAFEKLGVWSAIEPKIAGAENVRAALQLVAREEAKYGVVYGSDAVSEPKVTVVGTFPKDSHPPIIYPFAVTKDATSKDAADYLTFLRGPEAAKIFESQGFTVLK
jgi:molybdate transport system substrate-binding protein